ncbi:MAG: Protein GrpE [Alphaproteobacteria bacterium MarineAlpha2_Bin1]|nr:MAG: Protein GrpE [Alphaproteobacteria bacterium MarineAlpha2_Bin1]|tara:strand:- start:1954 stop:2610 length:657 start_codon:yes stop_codon:yes gene_type:complete
MVDNKENKTDKNNHKNFNKDLLKEEVTNDDSLKDELSNGDKEKIDNENQESIDDKDRDLLSEVSDLKDQLLRSMAEVENIRKRSKKELEDTNKYAITGFARDILSISDNLRRALESIDNNDDTEKSESFKNLIEGVELTERELISVLNRYGINKVDPIGERFDVKFHQAMFEEETSEHDSGTVIQVMQFGYVIQDRLLRPAMVGVAKKPKDNDTNGEN